MNEAIEKLLTEKGISPTAMRILVLEYMQKKYVAVGLPALERDFDQSDRVTLYRTLKTFEGKGLIHGIDDGTGTTKYAICAEACKAGDHYDLHLHFFCQTCKHTYCLPKHSIPVITVPGGFQLKELNLLAKGKCDQCITNNAIVLHGHAG